MTLWGTRCTPENAAESHTNPADNEWGRGFSETAKKVCACANATGKRRKENGKCEGAGTIRARDIEATIFAAIKEKLCEFQTLQGEPGERKPNPVLAETQLALAAAEAEIAKLIDSLGQAGATLMTYMNARIEELDARKQTLAQKIHDLTRAAPKPQQTETIAGHIDAWDGVSFDDKRKVVAIMIKKIKATQDQVHIEWHF